MKKNTELREIAYALKIHTMLAIVMFVCLLIGLGAGVYLDSLLGTTPWLLLIGILLGAASAFKVMYDMVIKKWSKNDK